MPTSADGHGTLPPLLATSLLAGLTALAGCGENGAPDTTPTTGAAAALSDGGAPEDASSARMADAGVPTDAAKENDAALACATNPVELLVGDGPRYFVPVTISGEEVALQLDTGSSLSFLFQDADAPPYTAHVADARIGCEDVPLAGRNVRLASPTVGGRDVIGLLGMDYLLARPTLLDVEGRALVRHAALPTELVASAHAHVAFDDVRGHALVPLTLDGRAVRLMFDTGGGDTLWIGEDGRPGDRESSVVDAEGNVFSIFTGTGVATFTGVPPRTIPVARAKTFPYFGETVRILGGNLHGLLGVSAFPGERILVADGKFHLIRAPHAEHGFDSRSR
ncbi:MAG: hypothetical protein U0169_27610 [Polyangiaceae bacterium]